jgi:predicted HicB family RNase H-like nuclease
VKKAVRGRPPRAEEAAERRLTIRWSGKEYRLVERAADSSGNSLAAWARTVLLDAAKRGPAPRRDGAPDADGRSIPTSDSS